LLAAVSIGAVPAANLAAEAHKAGTIDLFIMPSTDTSVASGRSPRFS